MKKLIAILSLVILLCACVILQQKTPQPFKATKVLVFKEARTLQLLAHDTVKYECSISLGHNPVGAKQQQGDRKTPEGHYFLDYRNEKTLYYKAIHISYPNQTDRENARKASVSPGGDVMIHGIKKGWGWIGRLHLILDWTLGCIAVTNHDMDVIWNATKNGAPIEIRK